MYFRIYTVEITGINKDFSIENKYRIATFVDGISARKYIETEISKLDCYEEIFSDDLSQMRAYAEDIQVYTVSRYKFKRIKTIRNRFYCSDYVYIDLIEMPILGKIEFRG